MTLWVYTDTKEQESPKEARDGVGSKANWRERRGGETVQEAGEAMKASAGRNTRQRDTKAREGRGKLGRAAGGKGRWSVERLNWGIEG